MNCRRFWCLCCALVACTLGACSPRPTPPKLQLDPAAGAATAMQAYDKNGDGALDEAELKASPAIASGIKQADKNSDGKIDTAELTARIDHLLNAPVKVVTGRLTVLLDDKPLSGAQVTFEPEAFMGTMIQPAHGETDATGSTTVVSDNAQFPGYYLGYYKVRISKQEGGQELVPERYNTQTTLGLEASDVVTEVGNLKFELTSR